MFNIPHELNNKHERIVIVQLFASQLISLQLCVIMTCIIILLRYLPMYNDYSVKCVCIVKRVFKCL